MFTLLLQPFHISVLLPYPFLLIPPRSPTSSTSAHTFPPLPISLPHPLPNFIFISAFHCHLPRPFAIFLFSLSNSLSIFTAPSDFHSHLPTSVSIPPICRNHVLQKVNGMIIYSERISGYRPKILQTCAIRTADLQRS